MTWFITNFSLPEHDSSRTFATNLINGETNQNERRVIIDGFIIPRVDIFETYKSHSQEDLLHDLIELYGNEFINYIKGVFTVIIVRKDGFQLFSDHHGMKKYFIYRENDKFYITNNLSFLSERFDLRIDRENAAMFILLSHFVHGATLFSGVESCRPAEMIEYRDSRLFAGLYWKPSDLFKGNGIKHETLGITAARWLRIIESYIEYLKPAGYACTLTGGNDSRMVLAALLRTSPKCRCFTYGNPNSYDGVIAAELKRSAGISHTNYYVENPTSSWFEAESKYLSNEGNSLVNIHRAHRNDACRRDKKHNPDSEMLFTGLVGGEYIKEPEYDDKVIPVLFRELNEFNAEDVRKKIESILRAKGVRIESIDTELLISRLMSFLKLGEGLSIKEKKFLYTYYYYGCSHHSQDTNVFGLHFKYVINPFTDIDFLEMLKCYKGWYIYRRIKWLNRLFHSEFIAGITDALAPELSDVPYAKRGAYTANDLLRNRAGYLIKRAVSLLRRDQNRFPPNFPLGSWMYDFCRKWLEDLADSITDFVDTDVVTTNLEKVKGKTTEEEWHIVTNIVNIVLLNESFCKG